jgi:hypothetical protein
MTKLISKFRLLGLTVAVAVAAGAFLGVPKIARSGAPADFGHADWEMIREEEGIRVFRWEPPGSDLFAFKSETVMDAPMPRILSVLVDVPRRKEWMPNLLDGHTVRVLSPFERVEYMAVKTPPLTANRDFVFHAQAEYDKAKQQTLLRFTSVTDPAAPELEDFVRGRVLDSTYTLRALPGNKTFVELRVHVDPRGSVADWIVNFVTRNTPYNTLVNVRSQVARSDVTVRDDVKALLGL